MARWYYLTAAFASEEAAHTFAATYQGRTITVDTLIFPCQAAIHVASDKVYWCTLTPEGVSLGTFVPYQLKTIGQLDRIAAALYQWLRELRGYHCAIIGWEVGDYFIEDVHGGFTDMRVAPEMFTGQGWHGLVISEILAAQMTDRTGFEPFAPGYVWRPYQSLGISGW